MAKLESPIKIQTLESDGLIPGSLEPITTTGFFHNDLANATLVKFSDLINQDQLLNLDLTSKGEPLYYKLSETGQTLSAFQGANGSLVFECTTSDDSSYSFTLFNNIDAQKLTNLINNNHLWLDNIEKNDLDTWQHTQNDELNNYTQIIDTNDNETYNLSFYYRSSDHNHLTKALEQPIEVLWNEKLILTIDPSQNLPEYQEYIFNLDGKDQSMLTIRTHGDTNNASFEHIKLISNSQIITKLEFSLEGYDQNDNLILTDNSKISLNVATTPPVELANFSPANVVYDQAVYQTIVINNENPTDNPLNTLNLEHLFDNLEIPSEQRKVDIVQKNIQGNATDVYEVQISSSADHLEPIAVADIKLSFHGGDGGLDIFSRNIQIIDE